MRLPTAKGRPMLIETDFVAESLVAHLTRERPLAVVRPPSVHLETMRRREHFLALDAREIAAVS